MYEAQAGLRERQRRTAKKEVTDVAYALFTTRGYRETTIEDIAEAAGMSRRTVFRYFPTKEDIVLGKVDLAGDEILAALADRPAGEPVWTSLIRSLDGLVRRIDNPEKHRVAEPIQRMVFGTPILLARYLAKMQYVQEAVVDILRERAETDGRPMAAEDPAPRVLTAAAFGCLNAAHLSWLATGAKGQFSDALTAAVEVLASAEKQRG